MARKARMPRTENGKYLRNLEVRILDLEIMIEDARREKRLFFDKISNVKSDELRSMDYSADKVMCSGYSLGFADAMARIDACNANINRMLQEKEKLVEQKNRLESLYENEKGTEARVFYLREVLGYTQEATATKMGYSTRQIQRIEKKMMSQVSDSDTI